MDGLRARAQRPIRELLLAVALGHGDDRRIATLIGSVNADELVEAASRHRVVSLLYDRLYRIDPIPKEALNALARPRLAAQARRHLLQQTLAMAMGALDVPALVIKGHVLAADWYDDPMTRDFNDIDLVVNPTDFGRAVDALESAGIAVASTNWHGFRDLEVAEIPLRFRATVVDLHWHVVAIGQDRRRLRLPTAELFDRAVSTRVDELDLLTLGPVDTLLHLCVNAGLGGGRRLRGLIDIDSVLQSGRVDVAEFAARAHQTGAGRICAAMLQRSSTVLARPVPPRLLDALSPSRSWLIANRVVDRVSLASRRSITVVPSGLLLGSGRATSPATMVAFTRAVGRALATRVGRPGLTDPGGRLDWRRLPADGQVAVHRREYFDWVASKDEGP
jgi:Uncharacterised nucleotidyltransferase